MQKITPFLWFDNQAEEALNFYVSIFKHSKIIGASHNPDGSLFSATFQLEGQQFMALNGGPRFKFTEAISLFVDCKSQEEVDFLWEKLVDGGEAQACGWLKDKYGLSWQIIPKALTEMLQDEDSEKAQRVTEAMLKMVKIDVDVLKRAYNQA